MYIHICIYIYIYVLGAGKVPEGHHEGLLGAARGAGPRGPAPERGRLSCSESNDKDNTNDDNNDDTSHTSMYTNLQ